MISELLLPVLLARPKIRWQTIYDLGDSHTSPPISSWLSGKWQGGWEYYGQTRTADLHIGVDKSWIRIRYEKRSALTILEQEIKVAEVDSWVFLVGTDYEFIEQGRAVGYYLDSFQLQPNSRKTGLSGIKTDTREIPLDVWFTKSKKRIG